MVMELKLTQSSLPTAIFNSSSFSRKHFSLLGQKWKIDVQRICWKGSSVSKKILVHVVKEGETLTSISKLYGVPILDIAAANKEIADVDLVYEGQHLNIPSFVAGYAQVFEGNKHEHQSPDASPNLRYLRSQWNQLFTVSLSHPLPLAKTPGSFLVLVPLIAFCFGCILGAFRNIVTRNLRNQAAKKSKLHSHRTNGVRWKTALSDLRDPDSLNAESGPDSDEELQFEDMSHDYTQLEGDYQKFLSECGMSNWGYWRGGSPK